MQPSLEKVVANASHSFHINHLKVDFFPSLRHYHPEVEILLVVKGYGTRYVGDSVERFSPGDIVMIGPNIPHEWCSDKDGLTGPSEAVYILFNPEILGQDFWNLPESKIVLKIIRQSGRGIKLSGKTREDVELRIMAIDNTYGFRRITLLLSILEMIAFSDEYQYLASPVIRNDVTDTDSEKFNRVYKYVIDNYHSEISLHQVAEIANLSVSAFCRYFKRRTNKTLIMFVNEIRIGHACRMLMNDSNNMAEIGYDSGFNNISHFNRLFKRITGFTPLDYRKKFSD